MRCSCTAVLASVATSRRRRPRPRQRALPCRRKRQLTCRLVLGGQCRGSVERCIGRRGCRCCQPWQPASVPASRRPSIPVADAAVVTEAGAGVTGAGVFHGSSTGLEAFHAATPAATAAAMTPTIRRPRFLGFSGSTQPLPVTARPASAAADFTVLAGRLACSWMVWMMPTSPSRWATASTRAGAPSRVRWTASEAVPIWSESGEGIPPPRGHGRWLMTGVALSRASCSRGVAPSTASWILGASCARPS